LKNFILEIGKDFTFIGEEYRVSVGNSDYYIDLLFYHRGLACLVAFELKIGTFKNVIQISNNRFRFMIVDHKIVWVWRY
jgi:predicted nuclease of restriction endonuclease-like (RecB) superfamily